MLTHREESADTNNDKSNVAVRVDNQILDAAELLVGLVVNFYTNQFGGAPLPLIATGRNLGACGGRSGLSDGRTD